MGSRAITPIGPFRATLRPPGSKSLTNRALLLAALAKGRSVIHQPLFADDTRQMLSALQAIGFDLSIEEDAGYVAVTGCNGRIPLPLGDTLLHLGNAGTAYRFLAAACCLRGDCPQTPVGAYRLDGIPRMRQRPIEQLVDALHLIGGKVQYTDQIGFPPLRIQPHGLRGGGLNMQPTLSSQYISALLQVAPYCEQGLVIHFNGPVTSRPYVEMTLRLMAHFGITAEMDPEMTRIEIQPSGYKATEYHVEPDASSASYFLAAAAIVPGSRCTIQGLGRNSLQGDVAFADLLHQMGADLLFGDDFITVMAPPVGQRLKGIDVDLNAMPDMAQTLAAVALFAQGHTIIRNVGNLRIKETDRMSALQQELAKLGARAEIDGDNITIHPAPNNQHRIAAGTTFDTYNDHRMAMSLALIGLVVPGMVINDPGCVDKTFPDYFQYLDRLSTSP